MTKRTIGHITAGAALAVAAAQVLAEATYEPVGRIDIRRPPDFGPVEFPRLYKSKPRRDWEQRQKPKRRRT